MYEKVDKRLSDKKQDNKLRKQIKDTHSEKVTKEILQWYKKPIKRPGKPKREW